MLIGEAKKWGLAYSYAISNECWHLDKVWGVTMVCAQQSFWINQLISAFHGVCSLGWWNPKKECPCTTDDSRRSILFSLPIGYQTDDISECFYFYEHSLAHYRSCYILAMPLRFYSGGSLSFFSSDDRRDCLRSLRMENTAWFWFLRQKHCSYLILSKDR